MASAEDENTMPCGLPAYAIRSIPIGSTARMTRPDRPSMMARANRPRSEQRKAAPDARYAVSKEWALSGARFAQGPSPTQNGPPRVATATPFASTILGADQVPRRSPSANRRGGCPPCGANTGYCANASFARGPPAVPAYPKKTLIDRIPRRSGRRRHRKL